MTSVGRHVDRTPERSTTMKSIAATSKRSIRVAILFVALSLGSIGGFAGNDVAADVLIPRESIGASGGGGGSAIVTLSADDPSSARDQLCPPCATP